MEIIENENAQFMLLAGFIIAIGLVITTALLSNIIFESNMAGEAGSDPSKYDIVNMIAISADEMRSAYRDANASGGTDSQKINNFTNQTQNFTGNLSKIYALHGGGVNASLNISNWDSNRKCLCWQYYAMFTNNGTANGVKNWTVMENVQDVSVFELRNVLLYNFNFTVYVSDQTTGAFLWSMRPSAPGGLVNVTKSDGTEKQDNPGFLYINLLTVGNGNPWKFNNNVASHVYKIEFRNGTDASGKFNIIGYTATGRNFTRARDYVLNTTVTLSTSRMRANITIPVSVPW